jgi:TolA-binding protein
MRPRALARLVLVAVVLCGPSFVRTAGARSAPPILVGLGGPGGPPAAAQDADEQYQYLVGLSEKGLHDRVVKEAQSFLQQFPRHEKADLARYRLACALFELKRNPEALKEFRELASRRGFAFEAEVAFRLGQCELEAGDCQAAGQALARVLALGKDYLAVPATFVLGEARFRCKDFQQAEKSYAAVLEKDAQGEYAGDAACGLAWCAFRQGQHELAVERISRALAAGTARARADELQFLLGEAQLELQRPQEALAAYRAVRGGPFADAAARGAAFAMAALGDHAAAARAFAQTLERYPESRFAPECALHAGIEALAAGNAQLALDALRSKAAGEGADALYWRARAESASGDPRAALATVEQALGGRPEKDLLTRLETLRGDVLLALGRGEDAGRAYDKAGTDYALQAAAVASLNAQRPEEAVRLAEKLLAGYPQSPYRVEAWLALGEGWFAQQQYARAEAAFRSCAQSQPEPARRWRALSRVAWCRYLQDDAPGAAKQFGELLKDPAAASASPAEVEETWFMLARSSEASDKQLAVQTYEQVLKRFPKGQRREEALFRRARLAPAGEGIADLEALLAERPDSAFAAEARYELGERLAATGKVREASAHYREVLERHSESELAPAARYGLAWCLYQQGSFAEAADALRPTLQTAATQPKLREAALELLVWSESKAGNLPGLPAAWNAFGGACQDDARLMRAAQISCAALRKAERFEDAQGLLDALAKRVKEPQASALLSIERTQLCVDKKQLEPAERELRKALHASPDEPALAEACFALGEACFEQGKDSKAVEFYDLAARDPAGRAGDRALYKAGFARLRAKDAAEGAKPDVEGAERCFATLVDKRKDSPLYGESLFLLGESQFRRGDFEAAIATLRRVPKEAPQHAVLPKALFRLGLALCQREQWKEGAEVLGSLLRRQPDFDHLAEAELWRGRALAQLQQPREARAAFERVIGKDKGVLSAQAHLELGKLHLAGKEDDSALSEFLKVAVLYAEPEEVSEALFLAGGVLEAQGDPSRAAQQYREIVDQHPKTRFAKPARERLRELDH